MWKVAIKYALIGVIFEAILFHLGKQFGIHPMVDLRHLLFDILLFAIFISLAGYEFKRYHQQGILHFWQGMTLGFLVYTPLVAVFGGFLFLYFDAGMMEEYRILAIEMLQKQKSMYIDQLGEDAYKELLRQVESISKSRLVLSALTKKLAIGFFVTPAISIVLRKKPV